MQINFQTNSGGTQSVNIQDFEDNTDVEYWGASFDEAINGSLKQNVKGLRKSFKIKYNASRDAVKYRDILNNIVTDLTSGLDFFYVGFDSSSYYRVVIDSDTIHKIQYSNQHGLFIPSVCLVAYELGIEVLEIVSDYGLITEAVTEYIDYGLITQTVTQQEDYASI